MAEVPASSQSSRPRTRIIYSLHPPPEPTRAFGFVLDNECLRRWTIHFVEESNKKNPDPHTYTPKEYQEMIKHIVVALESSLPNQVYCHIPDLPRIRTDLLTVEDPTFAYDRLVFALRDNSTSERLHAPLTPELIEAVRKELCLGDNQQPEWYRIAKFN